MTIVNLVFHIGNLFFVPVFNYLYFRNCCNIYVSQLVIKVAMSIIINSDK